MASFLSVLVNHDAIRLSFQSDHEQVKLGLTAVSLCDRLVPHYVEVCLWTVFWFVTGLLWSLMNGKGRRRIALSRGKGKGRTRQAAEGLAALGCKPTHLLSCGKALHNFSLKKVGGCTCRIRGRYEPGRGAAVLVASADAAAGLREAISCQETWGFLRGGRLRADRRIVWTVSIIVTAP